MFLSNGSLNFRPETLGSFPGMASKSLKPQAGHLHLHTAGG